MPDNASPEPKPHTLDDVMIAMDVVDMLRHREDLVHREMNEPARAAELIERLREIYREQGIEVPDRVLEDGVKALKDSRFTWTPPPPSWQRTLFEWWIRRMRIGAFAAVGLAALLGTCGVHYLAVTRPALVGEERARIEVTETLPRAVRRAHADITALATEDQAKVQAGRILAEAERAARGKDHAALLEARAAMEALRGELQAQYTLTIVSRRGEQTGVWRRPPRGSSTTARNYYLIVEAIRPGGGVVRLPIRNEENGRTEVVEKFGVRVPQAVWEQVAADKRDDGIVQRNAFGEKVRGKLAVDYLMPFEGGMITKW